MPHWSCSSVLCYNNHKSLDENGEKMKKYRLPTDGVTQAAYVKIFKTTSSFNWKTGFICAAHWSSGVRDHPKQLPDQLLPPGHFDLLKKKYFRAKNTFTTAAKPTKVQRKALMKAKQKYRAAKAIMGQRKETRPTRPPPKRRGSSSSSTSNVPQPPTSTPPSTTTPPPAPPVNHEDEIQYLRAQLDEKEATIKNLQNIVAEKSLKIDALKIAAHEKTVFSYEQISGNPEKLEYLTGLSLEQFNIIMDCVRPFIDSCLKYDDERKTTERTFSYETQYLIVMMVCRHSLDFKFVSFMTNVSAQTIGRIFNGWIIFLSTLFNKLDQ